MTPIVQLYWLRTSLGVVSGAVSAVAAYLLRYMNDLTPLFWGITIALLVYLLSNYALRPFYKDKVEKQSKIFSTAIGMYFFTWIAFFILIYTLILFFTGNMPA
jgi:hypothetical protein